jgi:hypothetical protein
MAAYRGAHNWINRHFPRIGRCEYCGTTKRRTEYATARPGIHTRNRADWFEFCRPCHARFDGVPARQSAWWAGKPLSVGHKVKIAAGVSRYWASRREGWE